MFVIFIRYFDISYMSSLFEKLGPIISKVVGYVSTNFFSNACSVLIMLKVVFTIHGRLTLGISGKIDM